MQIGSKIMNLPCVYFLFTVPWLEKGEGHALGPGHAPWAWPRPTALGLKPSCLGHGLHPRVVACALSLCLHPYSSRGTVKQKITRRELIIINL